MISKKERRDTILTICSRAAIVLVNLLIVVFIARFWGAEGKGYQTIFITYLGNIAIVVNIFTNSSVSFFIRKLGASKLYASACLWTFISSSLGVLLYYVLPICNIENNSFFVLLLISSLLAGYITFHNALYIGMQKIKYYNLIIVLQPLLLLLFMVIFYKIAEINYFAYFYAYILSLIMVISIAFFLTRKTVGRIGIEFDFSAAKKSFKYGFQNELSSFFQFLTTRLSIYLIPYYLSEASLGVFAVGLSISESVWHISRSISMVQYSKIIKVGNTQNARNGVITASLFSVVFSFICIVIILLLPASVFTSILTDEFYEVKQITLLMSPGILFVSFSNIYSHYFAALGKMKVLILKSIVGAFLTLILLIIFIPLWNLNGACITSSIAHFVGAAIVVVYFFILREKEKNKIQKI